MRECGCVYAATPRVAPELSLMRFLGIDPGASGAIAILSLENPELVLTMKLTETERDVWEFIKTSGAGCAILERVGAFPGQGVSSTFKFGASFGFCRGLLIAAQIPFALITPGVWQKNLGCLSKGDKNVTKAKAQELFPALKVTHAIADAILIAEYNRRNHQQLFSLAV